MAATMLTPGKNEYQISESDRQKILATAPNPRGVIPLKALQKIERQRQAFIKKFGNDGTTDNL